MKPHDRFRYSRLFLALTYLASAYFLYFPAYIPSLANSGTLGFFNNVAIIALILMGLRQFLYLFFSVSEEMRRSSIPEKYPHHPISIIVPAYNEAVVIKQTVNSLKQISYPEFEVLIIDDGSSDGTADAALEACGNDARFKVIKRQNAGKAKALNFGIENANYDFIFCMDADTQVAPFALSYGIRHFEDPNVAAVGGAVLVINQKKLLSKFQTVEYLIGLNFYKAAQSFLGAVSVVPGPSGLFRKQSVMDTGCYESDTYAEDFDLTLKLINHGYRIVYEPYMEVKTEVPEDIVPLIKQRYRWNRGILQVLIKQIKYSLKSKTDSHGLVLFLYMILEALALPVLNVGIACTSLMYQLLYSDYSLFSIWLIVLIFLDVAVLLVTLADNRWPLKLMFYLVVNRFTYALFHDLVKIFSSVEQLLGVRMAWGKLERVGSHSTHKEIK